MKKKINSFNPLVSIVIPVYNGSNYLAEAIESALNQTYENIEIIIVNDGSNDNGKTEKIVKKYEKENPKKIRYFKKENGGVATALNFAIKHMNGEYFSWLSHDDTYHKDKIKVQIEALSKVKKKETLVTCGYSRIDNKGKKIEDEDSQYYMVESSKYTNKQLSTPLFALLIGGCIFGCSLLIHKSHFQRVGLFNPSLLTNDYDMWFRIMRGEELMYIREPYAFKRIHKDQDTNTKSDCLSAAWFSYFIDVVNNLSNIEMTEIYGSRKKFEDYVKYNIGFPDNILEKIFHAKSRDEIFYIIVKERTTASCNEKINNAINDIKKYYESSRSWKVTKPLRFIKNILK